MQVARSALANRAGQVDGQAAYDGVARLNMARVEMGHVPVYSQTLQARPFDSARMA
jgi:hypothetical protein